MSIIKINPCTLYMCTKTCLPYVAGEMYWGDEINPNTTKNWYRYFREATDEEIEAYEQAHKPPQPEPQPEPEPEPAPTYDEAFEGYLARFGNIVTIPRDSENYKYLYAVYQEAKNQFFRIPSDNGLPVLLKEENFQSLHEYGDEHDTQKAFDALVSWLFAMHIASLCPACRTELGKIGYCYDRYTPVYGFTYDTDPNNMRLLAGVIHAAMRGVLLPDTDVLREELGGKKYDKSLSELASGTRTDVGPDDFFTDLREFMPTAPGPYAPGYTNRPDNTYQTEPRDSYGNLQVDRDVHEAMVIRCNLDTQDAVQAIADKEGDARHLFGEERETEHYHFNPVFGKDVLGQTIDPDSLLAVFATAMFSASSSARGILQAANVNPVQYGRLRPGCSWKQEACKNSTTDDRRNILTNFEIEDGDGCPTGYYDQNGDWMILNGIHNPEEYEEQQKKLLYANSYPSGHSAGIMGVALLLIELFPHLADVILCAAIEFSLSRSKARYHWLSDIINGRVLGVWQSAVSHAAADYDETLARIRRELGLW